MLEIKAKQNQEQQLIFDQKEIYKLSFFFSSGQWHW